MVPALQVHILMTGSRPSATAYLVAKGLLFLSFDPQLGFLVPGPAAEASGWFVESQRLLRSLKRPWFRALVRLLQSLSVPGILLHYALRKRYLEETVRNGLRDGFRQVVILGAGFDTLAWRLHREFPEAGFWEVDHPLTQREKRRVLDARGGCGANLHFLPVDFANFPANLPGSLRGQICPRVGSAAYDLTRDTLFVAEGVLMYLKPAEIDAIFEAAGQPRGRSRFAFTFMGPEGFVNASPLVGLWLRLKGEPFQWSIRPDDLPAYLKRHGWALRGLATAETLRSLYLPPSRRVSLARGESICIAERLEKVTS
jgi:methyltransferase (TIGR00027 family)